jgi:rhodanese-related sulfurtransferase
VALTRRFHIPSAVRVSSLRLEVGEAHTLVSEGATLIDVRRQDDPSPSFPGAVRIPPDEIPGWIEGMRPEVAIVLACT